MKKRKIIGLLVIMAFALTLFVGCGEKEAEVDIVVTEDYIGNRNAETVITVAMSPNDTIASTYTERSEWAAKAYREWAEANPNYAIDVEFVDASQIAVEMSKFLTQAEMGVGPDVLNLDSFYVGRFLDAGVLEPIDDLVPQEDLDQFFDWTKDVTVRDGRQYVLWGETDARLLYYRNDLIDTPPRTWDELIEVASQINKETGIHGFLTPSGMSEAASNEGTWPYFWGQGGTIFGENSRPILGEGENRQKLINVYQFQRDLVTSGASPLDIASWVGFDSIMAEIAADNVAMFIHGTWAVNQLPDTSAHPELYSYTYLPMMEADQYSNTCGGWTWAVMTDDPEKKEAAISFLMTVIAGKEGMTERTKAHSQIPVRNDVFDTEYFRNLPHMSDFKKQFDIGHTRPASSLYPIVSDINAKMLGKVITGELTAEEAVDRLQAECLAEWESWKK